MTGGTLLKQRLILPLFSPILVLLKKEVVWDGKNPLNVTLSEDAELLDEVIVVGYGFRKKVI